MELEERMQLIQACLMSKDAIGVSKLILEDKFSNEDKVWELIEILGQNVSDDNLQKCPEFFESCESCMNYLVTTGNPKELLMALLEQADTFYDTARFQIFLRLIQICVLKVPSKQEFSVVWAVECVFDTISNLELPKDLELEGEEKHVHDLDPCVEKINKYVTGFLNFLVPFVDQVSMENINNFKGEGAQRQLNCLVEYLLKVLENLIVFLDLTCNTKDEKRIKSDSRICAEFVISLLLKLHPNLHNLIQESLKQNERLRKFKRKRSQSESQMQIADIYGDEGPVSVLALSCLAYLIHSEKVGTPQFPCLFSQQGIMELNLPHVLVLMVQGASEVRRKGVLLFQSLLGRLDESVVLTYEDLDRPEYFKILDAMFDIMVHCALKELRHICVRMVPTFIQLFSYEARYQIFIKLFGTLKHSGAYGYCVQLLKNQMEEILADSETGSDSRDANTFYNFRLKKLILLITSLSEGPATDLVENSDRIISVLNFTRYLVLKDPPKTNKTGFWTFFPEIEKEFLEALRTGLDMSKGHYQLELTGFDDGKKSNKSQDVMVEMSVSVAGFNLPRMPRGQKMEIMKQALNTLDLIKSLLVRVNELIDQQKKAAREDNK